MSAHTPGPWEAVDRYTVRGAYAMGDRSQPGLLAATLPPHAAEGDAHLIAAAPELLEFATEWLDRQGTDENYMVMKARAAIAKATGEAP